MMSQHTTDNHAQVLNQILHAQAEAVFQETHEAAARIAGSARPARVGDRRVQPDRRQSFISALADRRHEDRRRQQRRCGTTDRRHALADRRDQSRIG